MSWDVCRLNEGEFMKRLAWVAASAAIVSLTVGGGVQAKSGDKLPKITGGGQTENTNSGGPDQTGSGGFNAHATAPGVVEGSGDDQTTEFPAKGQVQAKSVDNATGETVARIHGEVVCIANYGPSDGSDGGVVGSDVWEIRFRITKASFELPPDVPTYGSLMVQDNGKDDLADETFDPLQAENSECGDATQFQLEPVIHGNIVVHDG
jgi:hypothetical protein